MNYNLFLDNIKIGFSDLENADPPMGVVSGKIKWNQKNLDYIFLSTYCKINSIQTEEYPEEKFISTQTIPKLKIYNENGIEIEGVGSYIEGMDSEGFEINIIGIPYPFYEQEFPNHVEEYKKSLE